MKLTLIALACVFGLGSPALAHEGHGHESADAPHGGILKEGKALNLEVVAQGAEITLYLLGKDGKAILAKEVLLSAFSQAPKKPKSKIELKAAEDHFKGQVKDSGSYRYELSIDATYKGKKDSLKIQIEPQG